MRPDAVLFNGGFCIPAVVASEWLRRLAIGLAVKRAAGVPGFSELKRWVVLSQLELPTTVA